MNADPRFVSVVDLRLRADSPARSCGGAANGGTLPFDLSETPRIQGGRIDGDAHEYDELFGNGFE